MKKKRSVKVPVIMQMEALECGAASLAMVLAYYKKWIPLEKVRKDCGVSRDGSNAANILKAARAYGLETKAWRYKIGSLKEKVNFPAIIHWNFNHFVVLCGFRGNYALINDPARGVVKIEMEEFEQSYTGICLEFFRGESFVEEGKPKSVLGFLHRRLKGNFFPVAFVIITMTIMSFIGIVIPVFERIFTDYFLTGKNLSWIPGFMMALFFLAVLYLIVGVIKEIYLYKIKGKLSLVSNAGFMQHILHLPMEFFSQRMAGDLAARQRLNDNVAETLISKLAPSIINAILLIFYFVVMIKYNVLLTFVGMAVSLINLMLIKIVTQKRIHTTRLKMRYEGKVAGATVSGISMIETIKASGAEDGYFQQWAGYQASANNAKMREIRELRFWNALPGLVQELADIAILILGVYLIMKNQFSAGMLLTFQSFMAKFMEPVDALLDAGESIQEMRTSMERIEDVMNYKEDATSSKEILRGDRVYEKLTGEIELKNVTFGYSKLAPPLLKNFSLTIHPGDKVAFVGFSGCGKSTIAKLITGLYEPWEGEILFDGKPLTMIPKEVFHGSVSMVDQEVTIFEDTISNNIKIWDRTIEDYEIILAAKDAGIHNDIIQRQGGYGYKMKEGGRDFSGGQCQRMEIARALSVDPTVVILDEATSALDAKTEFAVMEAIKQRGITSIVIAHRLSTIRDCNQIIVMSEGNVVEMGTHEELFAKGGVYTKLITTE